jgi:hypothetical protein
MFSNLCILTIAAQTVFAGQVQAQSASEMQDRFPVGIAHPDELFMQDIASRMFWNLPTEQQITISKAGGIGSPDIDLSHFARNFEERDLSHIPRGVSAAEYLEMLLSDEIQQELNDQQLEIINNIASLMDQGNEVPAMCFAPDADQKFAFLIDQMLDYQFVSEEESRYQQGPRWTRTATDGAGLTQGDPTVITYSFAPDGSFVPDAGLGSGNSAMFQWLNGIYGSSAVWQQLFHQVFDRWEELTGVTYVWEENDDGVNMSSAIGVLGVRGDVRIFAFDYPFDGNGGVLAYNFFPNNGDMAFDAFDSFYNTTTDNSLRFRNVAAHEHGHGLGMPHVCPANQTKLMEPFVSIAYDGPQLDDVLNGIRNYGDIAEPNDNVNQATDLGVIQPDGTAGIGNLGVDDNTDSDFFKITVTQSSRIHFTATPDADEYIQGPQTQACNDGVLTNYNTVQDLQISVVDSSGTLIESVNKNGMGQSETMIFDTFVAEDVYFVVDGASNVNDVQRYIVDVSVEGLGFINPVIFADIPESVNPGFEAPFAVTIIPQSDIVVPGTEKLFYAANGNAFESVDLVYVSGNDYTAAIPAAMCNDSLSVYLSVEGETAGEVTLPLAGASNPFHPMVKDFSTIFIDDFETDLGWTVSGPVSGTASGEWERGIPEGFGDRGDPIADADFSGSAFLTGNAPGNTDVDGGQTILTSPTFMMASTPEAIISYARWYDNTGAGTGTNPGLDVFTVEISNNNGGSWSLVETVGPMSEESVGGWFSVEHRVADFVTPTNQIQVRFIAEDIGEGSVVEAAIDQFLTGERCEEPKVDCRVDLNSDGLIDFFDVSIFLTAFNTQDPIADFENDGAFDFFDISVFLIEFNAGCP